MGLIILCEESFCRRKMSMTQDEKWHMLRRNHESTELRINGL